jgi:hypothetical protein
MEAVRSFEATTRLHSTTSQTTSLNYFVWNVTTIVNLFCKGQCLICRATYLTEPMRECAYFCKRLISICTSKPNPDHPPTKTHKGDNRPSYNRPAYRPDGQWTRNTTWIHLYCLINTYLTKQVSTAVTLWTCFQDIVYPTWVLCYFSSVPSVKYWCNTPYRPRPLPYKTVQFHSSWIVLPFSAVWSSSFIVCISYVYSSMVNYLRLKMTRLKGRNM